MAVHSSGRPAQKLAVAVLTALSHRDDAERRAGAALQMVTRDE